MNMEQSTIPGHFFQTDASESTRARKNAKSRNTKGDPLVLQSKVLNVLPDPFSKSCVYVAESTGCVRRVDVEARSFDTVYGGPAAPLTSLAIGGQSGSRLFAGCWDKNIWSWDLESRALSRRYNGHSDFVKAVLSVVIGGKDCLISGGSDAKIIVWDTSTGERLHVLRDASDSMMAVQDLAVDPQESTASELVLVSSSSDPHIRRWRISLSVASQIHCSAAASPGGKPSRDTILEHDTSVYKLAFWGIDDETDLWTASADGTTKCLSRAKDWATEETYEHGDYVRALAITEKWVVTAGRDENVKVWDKSTGQLWHVFEGHFEEVTGLVVLDQGLQIVSVSIDCTLRIWPLGEAALREARAEHVAAPGVHVEGTAAAKRSLLTDEEEAELAGLMADADAEHNS